MLFLTNIIPAIIVLLSYIACGVVMVVRFWGSKGAFFGGLAFGLLALGPFVAALATYGFHMDSTTLYSTLAFLRPSGLVILVIGLLTAKGRQPNLRASAAEGGAPVGLALHDVNLVGIRGWLILPAIGLPLGLAVELIALFITAALLSHVQLPQYRDVITLELFLHVALWGFLLYVATCFFRKKRNAPLVVILFIVLNLAVSILLLAVDAAAGTERLTAVHARGLAGVILAAAIWIPYFRVSKRVKATFVN